MGAGHGRGESAQLEGLAQFEVPAPQGGTSGGRRVKERAAREIRVEVGAVLASEAERELLRLTAKLGVNARLHVRCESPTRSPDTQCVKVRSRGVRLMLNRVSYYGNGCAGRPRSK